MNESGWKATIGMILVITALTLAGSVSHAQWPRLNQLPGIGKAQPGGGDVNAFNISVDVAVHRAFKARLSLLEAQVKLAEALGIKTDAYVKASESARAGEGATSDKQISAMKDSVVSPDAKKEMEAALAESKILSEEAKKTFAEGGGVFCKGLLEESVVGLQVANLVQQGSKMRIPANPLDAIKIPHLIQSVASLSSIVLGDLKEDCATGAAMHKFSQKQNIEIPGENEVKDKIGGL